MTPPKDLSFANSQGVTIRDAQEVERIGKLWEERLTLLSRKVPAVVEYDNFTALPDAEDAFFDMATWRALCRSATTFGSPRHDKCLSASQAW